MIELPFSADGAWLRCALHAHTTNSDGELAPERLAAHYERAGYDVLFITDHWVRTEVKRPGRILVIPSVELNATLEGSGSDAHVLALGVDADPVEPGRSFPNLAETVSWIRANGGLPFLAHPYWSGLTSAELTGVEGLLGLEVYNAGCELEIGRGFAASQWDEALERGQLLLGIATDDSHLPGFDSGFASVWVRTEERTAEAILDALASGRFYSSTGPLIEAIELDEDAVEVRCSPAASVGLVTTRMFGSRVNAGRMGYRCRATVLEETPGGEIVAARLERWSSLPYGRVEVTDALGRRAWTNPLWFLPPSVL
jgi:hypothetical protein